MDKNIRLVERMGANALMTEYLELFDGYGKLPDEIYLKLKEYAEPTITPVRKILVSRKAKVTEKFQQLQQDGIISPVTKPA